MEQMLGECSARRFGYQLSAEQAMELPVTDLSTRRMLWIGSTWPEIRATAAGVRAWQFLHWLRESGAEVFATSPARPGDIASELCAAGFSCRQVARNDSNFDAWLAELQPDLVIFDRFSIEEAFSWRLRAVCPHAVRVLDTVDLHGLRHARRRHVESQPVTAQPDWSSSLPVRPSLEDETWLRELAAIHRSDLSLIVSVAELDVLREVDVTEDAMAYVSLAGPMRKGAVRTEREHFVSIGNFRHPPNLDSFHQLQTLWPRIRAQLPKAELHLYGAFPPRKVSKADDPDNGFRVLGPVEDQFEALASGRLLLAPLRFGGGLKGKIIDAWSVGTPVVTSSIGAEGLGDRNCFGGAIADTPNDFVACAVQLYQDEIAWREAQRSLRYIMRNRFSEVCVRERFLTRIQDALAQRDHRRAHNPVGAMLWQQGLRSTEYFSRYLELKNDLSFFPGTD